MGGGGKRPKITEPDPTPSPEPIEEQILAKDRPKKQAKKKGRGSQILAGQLNRQVLNFGKSKVGE
jgi:hypothetical protein